MSYYRHLSSGSSYTGSSSGTTGSRNYSSRYSATGNRYISSSTSSYQYGSPLGSGNHYYGYQGRSRTLGSSPPSGDVTWKPNKPKPDHQEDFWRTWDQSGDISSGNSEDIDHPDKEEADQIPQPKPKPVLRRFKVLGVDLRRLYNKYKHQTLKYESYDVILRRGQEFTVVVKLDQHFNKGEDLIKIQLVTGPRPRRTKGTMFLITPGDTVDINRASAAIETILNKEDGTSSIRLNVTLPSDAVVGRYTLCVWVMNRDETNELKKYTKFKVRDQIIVLFNPWCKDDLVYMPDEKDRDEYVLNQYGCIYVGSSYRVSPRKWVFGQFDKAALDAALYILEDGEKNQNLRTEGQGNPVKVARFLSAKINSNDDDGVLVGNWSGKYDGGTSPTAWAGSVAILEEYLEKKRPVSFGQCWVFSGVTTTVGRALGIPTRSVTNFDSAHDKDISMTIDYHVNTLGDPIKYLNDSVWNFHVWNEAWFRRIDLPQGYDGWQAFDATPQEQSDRMMQCGPAPVKAIREGAVHLGYDTPFIFAEVNGDRVTWEVNFETDEVKILGCDTASVGAKISTKTPGSYNRLDLTQDYKPREGSVEERCVARTICGMSSRGTDLQEYLSRGDTKYDVDMTVRGEIGETGDVKTIFEAVNTSQEERNLTVRMNLMATYYTGVQGKAVKGKDAKIKLAPGAREVLDLTASATEWLNGIDEDACLTNYVMGRVEETLQTKIFQEKLSLDKPDLELESDKKTVPVKQPFEVKISVTNPLDVALTNGSFLVDGVGLKAQKRVIINQNIGPREKVTRSVPITFLSAGEKEIVASFNSRQLVGIDGTLDIEVIEDSQQ